MEAMNENSLPYPTVTADRTLGDGLLFVLVGPSGVGKNALMPLLMSACPKLQRLPTATTRPQRENEIEGRDHYFVSAEQFQSMIEHNDLIEYQELFKGKLYGTPRQQTEAALRRGEFLLADIDIDGARALKSTFPNHVVTIFIAPPHPDVLIARLSKRERGKMSEAEIEERRQRAEYEMRQANACDYTVVNDTLEQCAADVTRIINNRMA